MGSQSFGGGNSSEQKLQMMPSQGGTFTAAYLGLESGTVLNIGAGLPHVQQLRTLSACLNESLCTYTPTGFRRSPVFFSLNCVSQNTSSFFWKLLLYGAI